MISIVLFQKSSRFAKGRAKHRVARPAKAAFFAAGVNLSNLLSAITPSLIQCMFFCLVLDSPLCIDPSPYTRNILSWLQNVIQLRTTKQALPLVQAIF